MVTGRRGADGHGWLPGGTTRTGWLFGQDQLVRLREAQVVFLPAMHDDDLALALQQTAALDPARSGSPGCARGRRFRARRLHSRPPHAVVRTPIPRWLGIPNNGGAVKAAV